MYLVYSGTTKYEDFLEEKRLFLNFENGLLKKYLNYEQYGAMGFRVIMQPSRLMIFCHPPQPFLESRINFNAIIDISSSQKGQHIFKGTGLTGDFSTLFFVFGSLLMFHFGMTTFVSIPAICFNPERINRHLFATLFSRILILTGFFLLLIIASYLITSVKGVLLSKPDFEVFTSYSLYIVVFLLFFFSLGFLMGILFKSREGFFIGAYLIWFLLVFIIPMAYYMYLEKKAGVIPTNELINMRRLENTEIFEKKSADYFEKLQEEKVKDIKRIAREMVEVYIKRTIPLNHKIENYQRDQVYLLIKHSETNSVFCPTIYYPFLSKEISGLGLSGHDGFLTYVMNLKDRFFQFYLEKRYQQIDQNVIPFIQPGSTDLEGKHQNVLSPGKLLPRNYQKGLWITLAYILVFSSTGILLLHWKLKQAIPGERITDSSLELDIDKLEIGKTYFHHSPGLFEKKQIIEYFRTHQAVIVERSKPSQHDAGTSLSAWVRFMSHRVRVHRATVMKNLVTLGISPIQLKQKIKNLDSEVFSSACLAIKLAQPAPIYVFDNFLDRVSRSFELNVKQALDQLIPHAILVYIGSQIFDITVKPQDAMRQEYSRLVAVDLNDICLR